MTDEKTLKTVDGKEIVGAFVDAVGGKVGELETVEVGDGVWDDRETIEGQIEMSEVAQEMQSSRVADDVVGDLEDLDLRDRIKDFGLDEVIETVVGDVDRTERRTLQQCCWNTRGEFVE